MASGGIDRKDRARAPGPKRREPSQVTRPAELSLSVEPQKAAAARGSDPYNTSGSFDRTKNWARVGKR